MTSAALSWPFNPRRARSLLRTTAGGNEQAMRHARVTEQEQDKASARGRDSRNVERSSCLTVSLSSDINNDLGGPLPRAPGPRSGRVLSRGKDGRATEPRRRVSAHPGHARFRATAARVNHPSRPPLYGCLGSLIVCATACRIGRSHAYRAHPAAPSEDPSVPQRSSLSSRSLAPAAASRAEAADRLTGAYRSRSRSPSGSSLHVRDGHTPPIYARRCGRRGLRGNPPAAGPPLRCGPWRDASVAWDASGL
jgi:hypothetical protein